METWPAVGPSAYFSTLGLVYVTVPRRKDGKKYFVTGWRAVMDDDGFWLGSNVSVGFVGPPPVCTHYAAQSLVARRYRTYKSKPLRSYQSVLPRAPHRTANHFGSPISLVSGSSEQKWENPRDDEWLPSCRGQSGKSQPPECIHSSR